ncbi:MAG: DUF421 domain-containing protein [Clostridia bacterium]|nr:DUF421 domain-containing protein [Clostridia bacterium]
MLLTALKTILVYSLLLLVIRLMGKREITQVSPFDFVVAIMIADLAVAPLEKEVELWQGIVPLAILAGLEMLLSWGSLHSLKLRRILDGSPQIVIRNGQILKSELRRARYNLNDLLAQLRENGYPNVEDVEMGVLETSGKLSVIPKSQKRPLIPADLKIATSYEGLPVILIMDGIIIKEELKRNNLSLEWLEDILLEKRVSVKEVFLATLNTEGQVYLVKTDQPKARKLW